MNTTNPTALTQQREDRTGHIEQSLLGRARMPFPRVTNMQVTREHEREVLFTPHFNFLATRAEHATLILQCRDLVAADANKSFAIAECEHTWLQERFIEEALRLRAVLEETLTDHVRTNVRDITGRRRHDHLHEALVFRFRVIEQRHRSVERPPIHDDLHISESTGQGECVEVPAHFIVEQLRALLVATGLTYPPGLPLMEEHRLPHAHETRSRDRRKQLLDDVIIKAFVCAPTVVFRHIRLQRTLDLIIDRFQFIPERLIFRIRFRECGKACTFIVQALGLPKNVVANFVVRAAIDEIALTRSKHKEERHGEPWHDPLLARILEHLANARKQILEVFRERREDRRVRLIFHDVLDTLPVRGRKDRRVDVERTHQRDAVRGRRTRLADIKMQESPRDDDRMIRAFSNFHGATRHQVRHARIVGQTEHERLQRNDTVELIADQDRRLERGRFRFDFRNDLPIRNDTEQAVYTRRRSLRRPLSTDPAHARPENGEWKVTEVLRDLLFGLTIFVVSLDEFRALLGPDKSTKMFLDPHFRERILLREQPNEIFTFRDRGVQEVGRTVLRSDQATTIDDLLNIDIQLLRGPGILLRFGSLRGHDGLPLECTTLHLAYSPLSRTSCV